MYLQVYDDFLVRKREQDYARKYLVLKQDDITSESFSFAGMRTTANTNVSLRGQEIHDGGRQVMKYFYSNIENLCIIGLLLKDIDINLGCPE